MRQQAVTVSAVLIVKDEEAVLAACLESVAWVDEIVVYDTGSTDRTREIAREHTDIVVEGYWDDDFAAARNRALAHATSDWVLSIDADEVLEADPARFRAQLGRQGMSLHSVMVRGTQGAALPLSLARGDADVPVARVFRRTEHTWRGALHEQAVRVDGKRPVLLPLLDVVLHHSGYQADVVAEKGKAERNVQLARHELDSAVRAGLAPAELEERREHLARSTVLTGRHREALDLADQVAGPDGFLNPRHAVMLAQAVLLSAEALDDEDAYDRWLTVWETHDHTPWPARAARARRAAAKGDAAAALAALEPVPTTSVDAFGERFERVGSVTVEVWALATLGRTRRAGQVALDAARRGVAPGAPAGLVQLLGHERTVAVLGALDDRLWREYATWCVMAADSDSLTFLDWMHEVRPADPTVLGSVALLAPVLSLEAAARWAMVLRGAGAGEQCPLVQICLDDRQDPRQRALAGALAFSAYGDERGLSGLEQALALVQDQDTAALLSELQVVAPGLVTAGADDPAA
ncbi:glycosyltransferase family 2 protein [Cellulomonas soli]|uniref:glycosyltransferase family 2 protein n=1 Tax=Cellulomonas soli TaxID=931535 RepID=UPI003F83FC5D